MWFRKAAGQLVVAMFLCYSGYGVAYGISKNGLKYAKTLPMKAVKLWAQLAVAVTMFYVVDLILGKNYSFGDYLFALTSWGSIGNSNWYITAIISLYLIHFVVTIIFKKNKYLSAVAISILTLGLTMLIWFLRGKSSGFTFNTLMCYPIGVWLFTLKDKFEKLVAKNDVHYYISLLVVVLGFALCYTMRGKSQWWYIAWTAIGSLMIVLITMKVRFGNHFLEFIGSHVFSIYVLQRIPMMIFLRWPLGSEIKKYPIALFVLSFLATIVISIVFDKIMVKWKLAKAPSEQPAASDGEVSKETRRASKK